MKMVNEIKIGLRENLTVWKRMICEIHVNPKQFTSISIFYMELYANVFMWMYLYWTFIAQFNVKTITWVQHKTILFELFALFCLERPDLLIIIKSPIHQCVRFSREHDFIGTPYSVRLPHLFIHSPYVFILLALFSYTLSLWFYF